MILMAGCAPVDDTSMPTPDSGGDSAPVEVPSCQGSSTSTYTTIQSAIDAATPGGTITICDGTYQESLLIDKDVELEAETTGAVFLDGNNDRRLVEITGGAEVTIRGFGILNGNADQGGGILLDAASLTLRAVTLTENQADQGGAVAVINGGALALQDSIVDGNSATEQGGAFYVDNSSVYEYSTTSSSVSNNSAPLGAIVYVSDGSYMQVAEPTAAATYSNNSSTTGGAVYVGTYSSFTLDGGDLENTSGECAIELADTGSATVMSDDASTNDNEHDVCIDSSDATYDYEGTELWCDYDSGECVSY